jgi:hypothetical protein
MKNIDKIAQLKAQAAALKHADIKAYEDRADYIKVGVIKAVRLA